MGEIRGASLTRINAPAPRRAHVYLQRPSGLVKQESAMTRNIGSVDRGLRIAAGLALLGLGMFGPLGWWGLVGLVPLATGLMSRCPAYSLLGVNTCSAAR